MRTDGGADGGRRGGGGTHIHPLSLSIFFSRARGPSNLSPLRILGSVSAVVGWRGGPSLARNLTASSPLLICPPPLQWLGGGAGPLIEPHLIAKEGPLPSPSEHSHSPFFSAALPLPCGDKEEGGGGHSPPSSLGQRPKLSSPEEGGRRRRAIKWAARPHHVQLIAAGGRWRPGTRGRRPKRGRKGPGLT